MDTDIDKDTEIDELRQEVEELKHITEDTNRQVHKMRRGARWATILKLLLWVAVFGISAAAYYYYVQPYVQKVEDMYFKTQQGATQAQNLWEQAQKTFTSYFTAPTSTQP